ncbi:MAG: sodium:solute symporter family protein [Candidatus Nealsonbacteria bacterium]|nr:sodium:solute symporter family protein [Candidatus Nealsonbacteria bacterium]
MELSWYDWAIIVVYLAGCMAAGLWMRRYVRGVDDFAVAGREMDLNLGIASLAATEMGLVTVMYTAELGFRNGPAGATVGVLMAAAMLVVGLTGFVIRPLRDAGVITIPQLFEKRFGKRVRWMAGLVVVLGGVLNMGIFLQVGGKFLVHVTGMDMAYLQWAMTALLGIVLLYTVLGGMLSVLVTDYIQFLVMGLGIVITSVLVVSDVGWSDFVAGLGDSHEKAIAYQNVREKDAKQSQKAIEAVRQSDGWEAAESLRKKQEEKRQESLRADRKPLAKESVLVVHTEEKTEAVTMGNPFNPVSPNGLGWMYVVWQAMFQIAVVTTWQTMIARVLSAKDSGTARRVYRRTAFYFVGRFALPGLWGAAAFLYFTNHGGLPEGVDSLTAMPAYLKTLLPIGIIGILIAAMLAAEMSTDAGYLLTWATVIYNDLVNPCLRRPMSPKAQLFTVRALVLAIGIFLLAYGLWYEIPGNAWDYLAVTGNIYLASVFTLLVGALYWRGSHTWGAVAAIVLGAIGPITFLIVNGIIKSPRFDIDPSWEIKPEVAGFAAFGLSFAGMFFGSLLGRAFGRKRGDSGEIQAAEATP